MGLHMSSNTARENIQTIAELEREFESQRTRSEALADTIADFVGSIPFVGMHLLAIAVWIVINLGVVPGLRPFDPFPFILLALIVSCEGVILATFVLMKQNRMSRAADRRAHLNLQIDLLAEKEITKLLQLELLVCKHMGIEQPFTDEEATDLSRDTAVQALAEELTQKLEKN